mgnify:CR=1 FL=1
MSVFSPTWDSIAVSAEKALVDVRSKAINKVAQMADHTAAARLYNQSVINSFTPSTPLYYLINSPSLPAELYIRIIPTNGADEKYAYE